MGLGQVDGAVVLASLRRPQLVELAGPQAGESRDHRHRNHEWSPHRSPLGETESAGSLSPTAHVTLNPPSTSTIEPVTQPARGEAR